MDSPGYNEVPEAGATLQKRNRKPVSCTPCRQRKLRCDQALPICDSCIRRGDVVSCSYQFRRAGTQKHWPSSSSIQSRMDRLEELVLAVMNQGGAEGDPTVNLLPPRNAAAPRYDTSLEESLPRPKPVDHTRSQMIKLDADYGNPSSIGDAHWGALLNEIQEVRGYIQAQQKQYEDQSHKISQLLKRTPDDPGALLFGTSPLLGHEENLAHIPSRYTCDMFVERYFSTLDPALHILHPPTFMKQYSEHWEVRHRTPVIWIGLLFAMLRIAVQSWQRDGDEPLIFRGKCGDLNRSYRTRTADCIILADYTRPQEYLIETLVLHLYGEYASHRDADSSSWVLLGTIIRLAMRLGYHRDPDRIPSLTPFQAEMRRRVWAFIRQADILFSFQHGLPSMVKVEPTVKGLPRNIYDDGGFGPSCTELPAPRPASEPTPISYLIAKARLALGFAQALKELNQEEAPSPYERVVEIDRSIREIYAQVPDHFQLRSMLEQQHDQPSLIAARFALANMHHKILCAIHSRFLEAARMDARFAYSRRACLESAMALLNMQAVQHQEVRAGEQTRNLTKYMTSLTAHDYLLAATILCTELCLDRGKEAFMYQVTGPTRDKMIECLDRSADFWSQMREESIEAYKASDVLGMLLSKLRRSEEGRSQINPLPCIYPTPTTLPLPEAHAAPNGIAAYPGGGTSDPRTIAVPPPQAYPPRDRVTTGYLPGDLTSGSGLAPPLTLAPGATPTPASTSAHSGFNNPNGRHLGHQDSSTTWDQFAASLDFSDCVSTLWSLNPGGRGY